MKILFTGGGSGGHITPIIAIVREFRKIHVGGEMEFFFIGPKDDFTNILLSQEGIRIKSVLCGKIRRYDKLKNFFKNFLDVCFKIPIGIIQSFFIMFFMSPDLVFSKGGYGSIPAVIAARILFIPVFLHEADVVPGKSNMFLSKSAKEIFVSFPNTSFFPLNKITLTGNPIRTELLNGNKEKAKETFKIRSEKPVILVLGGSQGAQRINDRILESLPSLLEDFEIIHQCGYGNFSQVKAEAFATISREAYPFYHPFPFLKEPELKEAYAVSNLVIGRSGSGTIFEIAAVGKPSILIPLPESAQDHQVMNAYSYAEKGASKVIEESNFTANFFLAKLKSLFEDPKELESMSQAALDFARPNAAKIIANYLIEYLQ
jgi:UDP-N-acetylglucosamine--N-acetylmuramyl-(pentapeptide) pyrophosphoryl-undecaprenol N-acetylglucosamine transferase